MKTFIKNLWNNLFHNPDKVLIEVTQEHIDKGKAGYSDKCPVALAVKEKGYYFVSVGLSSMRIFKTKISSPIQISMNNEIRTFIGQFDNKYSVQPFNFTIDFKNKETI